jgi:hypothetical protein
MPPPRHIYTFDYVRHLLDVDEDLLWDIYIVMDEYRGAVRIVDGSDNGIPAFTDAGIDSVRDFLDDIRTRSTKSKQWPVLQSLMSTANTVLLTGWLPSLLPVLVIPPRRIELPLDRSEGTRPK